MKTSSSPASAEPLTVEQMRKIEADAIASGRVSGAELMERAGQAVVAALVARWGKPGCVVVLCGPGNNGGDGYVIARLLARDSQVSVFAAGDPDRLPADARLNLERWREMGGDVSPLEMAGTALTGADTVVDALFGIGLVRPLSGEIGALFDLIPASAHRVAVDVPSGWDADAAVPLGPHVFPAELTVTFHAPKRVHAELVRLGQDVIVAGIGL